jgi:hypothetical protein
MVAVSAAEAWTTGSAKGAAKGLDVGWAVSVSPYGPFKFDSTR